MYVLAKKIQIVKINIVDPPQELRGEGGGGDIYLRAIWGLTSPLLGAIYCYTLRLKDLKGV